MIIGLAFRVKVGKGKSWGEGQDPYSTSVNGGNAPLCCSPTAKKTHMVEEEEDCFQ